MCALNDYKSVYRNYCLYSFILLFSVMSFNLFIFGLDFVSCAFPLFCSGLMIIVTAVDLLDNVKTIMC